MKTLEPKGVRVSFANNVPHETYEDKGGQPTDVVKKRTGTDAPRSPSPAKIYPYLHGCHGLGASNLVRSREDAEERIRIRAPEVPPELHIIGQPLYEEKEKELNGKGCMVRPSSAFSASSAGRGRGNNGSSSQRPSSASSSALRRPSSAPSLKVREKMTSSQAQGQPNNESCNCGNNNLVLQRSPYRSTTLTNTRRLMTTTSQHSRSMAWETTDRENLSMEDVMPCYAQMLHKGRAFKCNSSSVQTKMQPTVAGFPGKPPTAAAVTATNGQNKNRCYTPKSSSCSNSFYPPILLELQREPYAADRRGKKSSSSSIKQTTTKRPNTSDGNNTNNNHHQRPARAPSQSGSTSSSTNFRFTCYKNGVPRRVPRTSKDALYNTDEYRRDDEYRYAEYISMRLAGAKGRKSKEGAKREGGEGGSSSNGRYNSLVVEGNIIGGKVCCFDERPATTPFGIGCKGRSHSKCNYKVGFIVIPQGPCAEKFCSVARPVSAGEEKIDTEEVQKPEWKC